MDSQDHRRTHIPGHEIQGVHLCNKCGWPFPNPHPSAKHRRAHKRICGTIEGYKLLDTEGHTHSNASDDSDDDHKTPSSKALEMGENEKGGGGIGEKVNRSEDEVFTDAVADFSDKALSSDSAISMERVDRKDLKFSEPHEDKGSEAGGVSQLNVKSSDELQKQSPEVSQSEGIELGKTLELQGRSSGFIVETSSTSDSDLKTESSTVVHSDDLLGLPINSHFSKAEAKSGVIPETGENVTDCSLTSVAEETDLKRKDEIESDRDMAEIVVSSKNVVGKITGGSSKIEVSEEATSGGEVIDGAAKLEQKNSVELSSEAPQDELLPRDVDSVVNTNAPTNVVEVEPEHLLQFAASSDSVKTSQGKGEENVNVYTLSNPELAHSQSEFENCKGLEGSALQDPLILHSSEAMKHEEDDLKETVTEKSHSNFDSNQLSEEIEVPSLDKHVLDDSVKQGFNNCEPIVEVISEEQAEVSPIKHTVDGDQRSEEIGASEGSSEPVMNKTCTVNLSEEPEPDDISKNLQLINLLEGLARVSSDNYEDFKDCEEVSENPSNLHSSEELKDEEDDLKDTINKETNSNFKSSLLSRESVVFFTDMHVLGDSIKQEQVHHVPKVEDMLAEEQAKVSPVTLTVNEENHSNFKSSQLSKESMVLSSDMHALDDSVKHEQVYYEPKVEDTLAEEQAEVSPVMLTVDEENHSNFKSSQLSKERVVLSSDMHALDDSVKHEQVHYELKVEDTHAEEQAEVSPVMLTVNEENHFNFQSSQLSKERVVLSSDMHALDDSIKHEQVHYEPKVEEQAEVSPVTLTVNEENHSNFKSSQLSKESEVLSSDMHVLDDSIKQKQVHYEPKVEDTLAKEQAEVSPVTLTAESNQRSDDIGASVNAVNTEMNESHVIQFLGEQKSDDVCKTSQEKSFPEDSVMASPNENPGDVSGVSSTIQTSVSIGKLSHCEKNSSEIDDVAVAVDNKNRGGHVESDIGTGVETLQPSDLLQPEAITSNDVFKSDDTVERGEIEKCDIIDTKDREVPIVSEDVTDEYTRKSTGIDCINIDAVSGTIEDIKGAEVNNNSKVQVECDRFVGTSSNLHQEQDGELSLKGVENLARELSSQSPLDTEQSSQSVPAVEPSGEASGTHVVSAQDRSGSNLIKFGSPQIDASVYSSSRCDSLEGNWGSVSVLSVQSDVPAVIDGEALPSSEAGKSNSNSSKAAPEGQRSEKSEMFEPPSFMTLVNPEHEVDPKASASEVQKGDDPQKLNQAGWFPTLTQVVNDSPGRKKNEEIIAKVTNWSTSKQHTPLKSLLGEAANNNKSPKSPKLEENQVQTSLKAGKVSKDNGSGLTTVNSILGPESPAAQAIVKGEAGQEWNSPARYPADVKREKRKVKSRPYWIQFVCCTSVDPR